MNIREKLRDAFRAYDSIQPAADAWEHLKAKADTKRPFPGGRALGVGLAVVLALGAIAGVRLIADRSRSQVRLLTPAVGPTSPPSLPTSSASPSPTSSPSVSPSPSPAGDKIHYVSADGVWEMLYPKTWFGPATAEQSWELTNYSGNPASVKLPIQVKFLTYGNADNLTLDDLLASMCHGGPRRQILECKKVAIVGNTWALVRAYSEEEDPVMYLGVRTIVGDKIYQATGYVYGTSGQEPAIAQIRDVFDSFVLNT